KVEGDVLSAAAAAATVSAREWKVAV
ncbi:MAG: hypothetical protein ACJATT_002845, partial [Myxococcota bacterium]